MTRIEKVGLLTMLYMILGIAGHPSPTVTPLLIVFSIAAALFYFGGKYE